MNFHLDNLVYFSVVLQLKTKWNIWERCACVSVSEEKIKKKKRFRSPLSDIWVLQPSSCWYSSSFNIYGSETMGFARIVISSSCSGGVKWRNSNEGCSEEHLKDMTYLSRPFKSIWKTWPTLQDVSVPQRRKKAEDC